jgi:hypothetical protein
MSAYVIVSENRQLVATTEVELIDTIACEARSTFREIIVEFYDIPEFIRKDRESVVEWVSYRSRTGGPDFAKVVHHISR